MNAINYTHEDYIKKLIKKNISTVFPIEPYIKSSMNILHKCKVCGHEWSARPGNIMSGFGCPSCAGNKVIVGKNDMWTTAKETAQMLKIPSDGRKYARFSRAKVDWVCPECNSIIRQKAIKNVSKQGLSCDKCSDGISFGNKMMANVLDALNIGFQNEKSFTWSENKRYDFYLPDHNMIVEVHGSSHYGTGFERVGGRTLEEERKNDSYKERIALSNGIQRYIQLDVRISSLDYFKSSFYNSKLILLLYDRDIDWDLCYQRSLKSKVIEVAELWNTGLPVVEIASILKISNTTVYDYLHKVDKIGLCKRALLTMSRKDSSAAMGGSSSRKEPVEENALSQQEDRSRRKMRIEDGRTTSACKEEKSAAEKT